MHSPKRIKITDVNPHLICVLCGGYYIDATTIIECLHSFCKSCIVRYLQKNKYCPICDVQVHKTAPLLNIRSDRTLQNIVYKLVPSLFKNEMERRVAFYENYPGAVPALPEQRGEVSESTPIFFPEELLILCLEYQMDKNSRTDGTLWPKRYLHCPAAVTVSHLVKLIRGKFGLSQIHHVSLFFKDDLLQDDITIMDIAYTYQCRRKIPIHLRYRILELKKKTIRLMPIPPKSVSSTQSDFNYEKDCKESVAQHSNNESMDVVNNETARVENNGLSEKNEAVKSIKSNDVGVDIEKETNDIDAEMKPVNTPAVDEKSEVSANDITDRTPSKGQIDNKDLVEKSKDAMKKDSKQENSSQIERGASVSDVDWKEVQLQISENGVMSVRNMNSSECSPTPAVEAPSCPASHPITTSQSNSAVLSGKVSFTSVPQIKNTEPIVSVSKVSKDQVKKDIGHTMVANENKLSISRVSSPVAAGGGSVVPAKGDVLNRIVSKLSPNETVIGNTGVTIRPVTKAYPGVKSLQERKSRAPSNHSQSRYKTMSQAPTWNPSIDRTTMLTLKQNCDLNKPPRFFKMRNTPRYLGNPAEGVKPLYGGGGRTEGKQSPPKSPVKQPPPYTPRGQDKPPPPYTPRPAHTGCGVATYLPPNPYQFLYSGFPFSGASSELIRSMCASTAYHPSLPPSISMLYNTPSLQQSSQRSQPPSPSTSSPSHEFKTAPTSSTPPSIQRIPSSLSPKPLLPLQTVDDKKRDFSPVLTASCSSAVKSLKVVTTEDKPPAVSAAPIPLPPPPPLPFSEKSSPALTNNNNNKESPLPAAVNQQTLK